VLRRCRLCGPRKIALGDKPASPSTAAIAVEWNHLNAAPRGFRAAGYICAVADPHSESASAFEHWVVAERQFRWFHRHSSASARDSCGRFSWSINYDLAINLCRARENWECVEIDGSPRPRPNRLRRDLTSAGKTPARRGDSKRSTATFTVPSVRPAMEQKASGNRLAAKRV